MFYQLMEVIQNFFYGTMVEATTYEYMLSVLLSGVGCVLLLYLPFSLVRWFFRRF